MPTFRLTRRRTAHALSAALAVASAALIGPATSSSAAPTASPTVQQFDLTSPLPDDEEFGENVLLLSNGNYVVTDPRWDNDGESNVGAVILYDGTTDTPISILHGSTSGDLVGDRDSLAGRRGVQEVGNGNFVVISPDWDHGSEVNAGAVTFVDGEVGLNGPVTVANSLHGSKANDRVGSDGVTTLSNGNYVVESPNWANGFISAAGAATWADGETGITGPVTTSNSLYGPRTGDLFVPSVTALSNGNYVVAAPLWDNGTNADAGAAVWGSGTSGISGPITNANSLHGSKADDQVGSRVTALTNGNYVVASPDWDRTFAIGSDVGAVTWGDGDGGITGPVTVSNSLYGADGDEVGSTAVVPLVDGDYVVLSQSWGVAPVADSGAATWSDGDGGTVGPVTTANSLVGSSTGDFVQASVAALTNGNYVVGLPLWDRGGIVDAGASVWSAGDGTTTGVVSTANSLHGRVAGDQVGGATVLANGNYVVASFRWDNDGTADVGASTWVDGATGITGPVTTANSLYGTTAEDFVGGATALSNGNYVVSATSWSNGPIEDVGAVVWADGSTGLTGPITAANSLRGTTPEDRIGSAGVYALTNGNYVVTSKDWDRPGATNAGAVTWADGSSGTTGVVSSSNSLVGSNDDDQLSNVGLLTLDDGNYVITSPAVDIDTGVDRGAVTFGVGTSGSTGESLSANSVFGTLPGEISRPSPKYTANDAIAVPTTQDRVVLMRVDRAPFFTTTPPDVTVATAPGASSATVTYPTPAASDIRDTTAPAVACAPASGSSFPVGTTTVTCTATDSVGLTGTVSFTVTVTATPLPGAADAVTSLAPERFVDTRSSGQTLDDRFEADGKRQAGSEYRVQIAGRGAVPSDAKAVVINVTAIQAEAVGFVTAHPCVTPLPLASSLNYTPSVNLGNEVIIPLTSTGELCLFTSTTAHLTVDVVGYVGATSPTVPITPARYLDTRTNGNTFDTVAQRQGRRDAATQLTLPIAGRGAVPADAAAVIVNVTAIGAQGTGFITAHPCLPTPPNAASLNYVAGVNRGNELVAQLDANGNLCLFTSSATNLSADVVGYLPAGTNVGNIGPSRYLDTRANGDTVDDQNQADGKLGADTQFRMQLSGRPDIPIGTQAVVVNVTAIQPEGTGFITIHPCNDPRPNTASLNYVRSVNGGNEIITRLDPTGGICIYTSTATHLTADVTAHLT